MSLSSRYFRKLRKNLLTALYNYEVSKVKPSRKEVLDMSLKEIKPSSKLKRHAKRIINTVIDKREYIDQILSQYIKSTLFDRMGDLEKTILRIGAAEILFYRHLVPAAVAVNEAVNLAKHFVDDRFASLVNATLKDIVEELTDNNEDKKENTN